MSRLPQGQPWRAIVVTSTYIGTVALAFVGLPEAFGTIGLLYSAFVAAGGTLPVAILAPRPRDGSHTEPTEGASAEPVLRRPRRPPSAPQPPTRIT